MGKDQSKTENWLNRTREYVFIKIEVEFEVKKKRAEPS